MFSASRIVAIDDERAYLDQLCRALHGMGIPCIPIEYPKDVPPAGTRWFSGVRIAFCDLHLLAGQSESKNHFPAVGALLEQMITPTSGPLLLILWTAYPKDAAALEAYLRERHPNAVPVAVLPLSKDEFAGGEEAKLPQAVRDRLSHIPQLRSLLEWEDDVTEASNACVGALLRLALQAGGNLGDELDKLLSALAQAASSPTLAAADPGSALQEVLVPMLADSLSHLPDDATRLAHWKAALSKAAKSEECKPDRARAAAINTALSVVHAPARALKASERGAVLEANCKSVFRNLFTSTEADVLAKFGVKATMTKRWVAIQIETACDYAQQKSPCLPYVLALEVPADTKSSKSSPAMWCSPPFRSDGGADVRLIANVQFVVLLSPKRAKARTALYRLRAPWVNDLTFRRAQQESRPGIVALYG